MFWSAGPLLSVDLQFLHPLRYAVSKTVGASILLVVILGVGLITMTVVAAVASTVPAAMVAARPR
ncbi:hypothetical protein EJ03DRAFT_330498 [Teratosphaeria nubilosa]|uniref:Uncharacterized protein n=1 Tax=Teratosphaeria nubilosa TaxID=161662 RepID=A0A6G1L0Q4_9PEZI|nr:hypothetical protein EJ03DRAFT_330498 [Teratosphaeria nubilosa]